MNTNGIVEILKAETQLLDNEILEHTTQLKANFKGFLLNLEKEDEQTKMAFHLIVQSAFDGKTLTHEEKLEVENQLLELLKTADLVALTVLPGGTVFLVLVHFLKLNRYVIPEVFLKAS
jgi:hypothetical protein